MDTRLCRPHKHTFPTPDINVLTVLMFLKPPLLPHEIFSLQAHTHTHTQLRVTCLKAELATFLLPCLNYLFYQL